jgi:hypothetical protein
MWGRKRPIGNFTVAIVHLDNRCVQNKGKIDLVGSPPAGKNGILPYPC